MLFGLSVGGMMGMLLGYLDLYALAVVLCGNRFCSLD